MKNKYLFSIIILFLFLITVCPLNVYAASASVAFGGNSSYEVGKSVSIPINANNISGSNLMSVGGQISSSDSSCIKVTKISATAGTANGNTLAFSNMNGVKGNAKIGSVNIETGSKQCTATLTFSNIKVAFTDSTKLTPANVTKTITVKKYDNTLSSLNVSTGTLSPAFNSSTTSYTVKVDSNVSSINISGKANDTVNRATVSGLGTRNLSYGSNKINIVVKSENGSSKTYTINVERKDDRSDNNNLKSLIVNGGTLKPNFEKGTTSYKLAVDFSISKLDIKAVASDSKAKVTISNPNLVAEEVTDVIVKVQAENGSIKSYKIAVSRGKDPNKKLSTDNYLTKLDPSVGILSPAFDKEKTNYVVYLPYEVDKIDFKYEKSEKKYATVVKSGSDKLKPDSANKITYTVTAEDNSKRTYTITIYRGALVGDDSPKTKGVTQLKSLTVKGGKLNTKFNPDVHTYYIEKGKDFKYEYELSDDSAFSSVFETEDSIYIIVESPDGDIEVYSMHVPVKDDHTIYLCLIGGLTIVSAGLVGILLKNKKSAK